MSTSERNYFASEEAARQYARARPYFHPIVIKKIKDTLQLDEPLQRALDIGCGTGLSTIALKSIAEEIVGTDIAQEMLSQTQADPRIQYVHAPAEQLPLPDTSFELVTVSVAFHWFDRSRSLREIWRVLRPSGWLVIYNFLFNGHMVENILFERWNRDVFLVLFPPPVRNNEPVTEEEAQLGDFQVVRHDSFLYSVSLSPEEIAAYLMSQTNVLAAIEQGERQYDDTYNWILRNITPYFELPKGTFVFDGTIEYLRKGSS
jgi:ubiquinone/menaquinone biosynthesis C-methylase UbiE